MSAYGDATVIAEMIGTGTATSAGLEDRIAVMNQVVSALIEEKTGRTWTGAVVTPSTKTIYPTGGWSSVLALPVPATTITGITVSGTDEGSVITAGDTLDAVQWSVAIRNRLGEITAIRSTTGAVWVGFRVVQITGTWADSQNAVPKEIEWVANYITAERIKQEQANPAGYVGPDGSVIPIRDPWSDTQVKAVIERHRLTSRELVL